MNEIIKGFKVFNPDWTCRGKQYTCPGTFEEDVSPSVCDRGMHFCKVAPDFATAAIGTAAIATAAIGTAAIGTAAIGTAAIGTIPTFPTVVLILLNLQFTCSISRRVGHIVIG